jgi:hypothetical protein
VGSLTGGSLQESRARGLELASTPVHRACDDFGMAKLAALVAKYERVKQVMDRAEEADRGEPLEPDQRSHPFPPATEAELRAFEKKLGSPLPPSYRRFLELHNGWQCFWGGTWIGGVTGKAKRWVDARLRAALKSKLKNWEWNPKTDLVLGASDNGGFLVFDATAGKNGERRVLDCPRGTFAENEFDSFADLLATQLRCREREVAKLPKALRG